MKRYKDYPICLKIEVASFQKHKYPRCVSWVKAFNLYLRWLRKRGNNEKV